METSTDLRFLFGQAFDKLSARRFQSKHRTWHNNYELTYAIHATFRERVLLPRRSSININQYFMFEYISLITGVKVGDISTAWLYELLFEIV